MNELEVKIFEVDKDVLISKLEGLGAKKIFDSEIVADFYKNDAWKKVRFRRMSGENVMTYKEKISTDRIMENLEFEVKFDKYDSMCKTFELLWFLKYWHSSKYRIGYKLWNTVYDFDKYEWIPWFIEIESDNFEDIIRWVELMGYKMEDTNTLTERLVKEHYWVA